MYIIWSLINWICQETSERKIKVSAQHRIQRSAEGEGAKKHEIYVAAYGGHLFYDLFLQGWGRGMAPLAPLDPLLVHAHIHAYFAATITNCEVGKLFSCLSELGLK